MPEETTTQESTNTETQATEINTNTDTNENSTDTGNSQSESQQSGTESPTEAGQATEQGQATQQTTGAEQSADELTAEGRNIKNILAAAELNPSMLSDPNVANIVEMANKKASGQGDTDTQPTQTNQDTDTQQTKETQQPSEEATETSTEESDTSVEGDNADDDTDDDLIGSALFGKDDASEDANFDTFEDVVKHIYKKHSLNENDPEALNKHFSNINKWRNDSQKLSEVEKQVDDTEAFFASLPPSLFNAVNEYANGQDWESGLRNKTLNLDFNKDYTAHNVSDVVNYYFPNEFDADALKDKEDTTAQKTIKLAERQYNLDKQGFQNQRAEYERKAQEQNAALVTSVDSSVEKLNDTFPDLTKDAEKKVRKLMKGGDILSLFYDRNGVYKADAAKKLVLVLFGEDEMTRLVKMSTKKAEGQATQNIVSRASDRPSTKKRQEVPVQGAEGDAEKQMKNLFPQSYY